MADCSAEIHCAIPVVHVPFCFVSKSTFYCMSSHHTEIWSCTKDSSRGMYKKFVLIEKKLEISFTHSCHVYPNLLQ